MRAVSEFIVFTLFLLVLLGWGSLAALLMGS